MHGARQSAAAPRSVERHRLSVAGQSAARQSVERRCLSGARQCAVCKVWNAIGGRFSISDHDSALYHEATGRGGAAVGCAVCMPLQQCKTALRCRRAWQRGSARQRSLTQQTWHGQAGTVLRQAHNIAPHHVAWTGGDPPRQPRAAVSHLWRVRRCNQGKAPDASTAGNLAAAG
eukprot:357069-Chlamydomonas_euryale.AAC.7